jgi:Cu-processing system ATP-binding protein
LKAIAGLVPPTSGEIWVDGLDVWKHPRDAKSRFSYLPQRAAFPENLTAREVLEFYCKLRRVPSSRAAGALARARLDSAALTSKAVGTFSGGMTQRLGIAVALLGQSGILILDEPTASLDPQGAAWFLETIDDLKRGGASVVFSSHILSDVASLADRVALLLEGRLVAVERAAELKRLAGHGARALQDLYLRYTHENGLDFGIDDAGCVPHRAAAAD